MAERLYSLEQVADLVGSTAHTVRGWVDMGWLDAESLPGGQLRVSERGLVRFLQDRGVDLEEVLDLVLALESDTDEPPGAADEREAEPPRGADVPPEDARRMPPPEAESAPEPPQAPAPKPAENGLHRLLTAILKDAIDRRAEAAHFEPTAEGLALWLRVDGRLHEKPNFRTRLPEGLGSRLLARIAHLAGVGRSGRGTFAVRIDDRDETFQVAACPTQHGVRLAVRPSAAGAAMPLDALGLSEADSEVLRGCLGQSAGLVLVAGPPRSGRTTTLRALVAELAGTRRRALAVTPAGGFDLPGVDRYASSNGDTVAAAIRTCADQGVDALVVDEIADAAAAEAAVQAAMAGHLVLATVPGRDPWPNPRLLAGGRVDEFSLASVLLAVTVQRLVRTVCPDCAEPATPDPSELQTLGFRVKGRLGTIAVGAGCPECFQTGYFGRTGLFSLLRMEGGLAERLKAGDPGPALYLAARKAGLKSLRRAARVKVIERKTTPAEAIRILGLSAGGKD